MCLDEARGAKPRNPAYMPTSAPNANAAAGAALAVGILQGMDEAKAQNAYVEACLRGAGYARVPLTPNEEAQLKAALPAGAPNVPRVQFSSQNFNITHQKTIIVDAAKSDGTPLSSTELPPTAEALVSSGNLQAFPNNWGQYAEKVNGTWTVVNPDYLTNPSALCAAQGCDTEWSPRDFLVAVRQYDGTAAGVTDPGKEGVSRIEGVFASDFGCAPGNVDNVGTLIPDLIVEGLVIVDPKVVTAFNDCHLAQMIGYLNITDLKTALLLNFKYASLGIKRVSL
jgi:hypothetical protein